MAGFSWDNMRLRTAGGLRYALKAGPEITHTDDATTAREVYLMRSQDLAPFIAEAMPAPYAFNFYVILPNRRTMPGTDFLITKRIAAKPMLDGLPCDPFSVDSSAPSGTYNDFIELTIDYEVTREAGTKRDQEKPETYLEHSVQVGGEFYELDTTKLRYLEDGDSKTGTNTADPPESWAQGTHGTSGWGRELGEKKLTGAKLAVCTIQHTFRWPFVLVPAWAYIFDCMGKINATAQTLFSMAPAETILFDGVSGHQKYVWNGAIASVQPWSLDFKFSQRVCKDVSRTPNIDIGWNHIWSSKAKRWVKPYWLPTLATDTGVPTRKYLYETTDLTTMFRITV